MPVFVPPQPRYKVAGRVTVRIVRYYINKGLVRKPEGYSGRNAVFHSDHVLQILAVKYLQSQYLPLKKIARRKCHRF